MFTTAILSQNEEKRLAKSRFFDKKDNK